jgi:hypothetical protein
VIIMWDGMIMLYEAIILMVLFLGYLIILFCSNCFARWYNKFAHLYAEKHTTTFSKNESKCYHSLLENISCDIFPIITTHTYTYATCFNWNLINLWSVHQHMCTSCDIKLQLNFFNFFFYMKSYLNLHNMHLLSIIFT